MQISLVTFGLHDDGRCWQETHYSYPTIADAVEVGDNHYRAGGYYVLATSYDPEQDRDLTEIVYESNTEGWCLQLYPFWRVQKVPAACNPVTSR